LFKEEVRNKKLTVETQRTPAKAVAAKFFIYLFGI
jgi:hypothetical protein